MGIVPGLLPIPIPVSTPTSPVQSRQPSAYMAGLMAQPLTQQYRIHLNISMHGVLRDITQEQLRGKRQSVVNDVKRLYFGILQTQSSLESVEENIRFLRELDRLRGRYLREQVVLESESLEVKARLPQAEQDQILLRNNLAIQKEQLNELVGRNILTEFRVNPVPEAHRPGK
jgi:outer membrane protein